MKAAVIIAPGCEEGEALTIVDIFRRAKITCNMIGLNAEDITGAHQITMRCDHVLDENLKDYDMVILPGGYEGTDAMAASERLRTSLQELNRAGKYIAALCAAPEVLDQAGLLEGKTFTCYPAVADQIRSGNRTDDAVVQDGNIITGKGPALAWAFAYRLVDILGGGSETVKKRMVYYNAFDVKEEG